MADPSQPIPSPLLPASTSFSDVDNGLEGNGQGIQAARQIATAEQRRIIEPWSRKKPYRKLSYEEQLWLQQATGMDEYRLINFFQNARARENKRKKLERSGTKGSKESAVASTSNTPVADSAPPRPSSSLAFLDDHSSRTISSNSPLQTISPTVQYPPFPTLSQSWSGKRKWEDPDAHAFMWPPAAPSGISESQGLNPTALSYGPSGPQHGLATSSGLTAFPPHVQPQPSSDQERRWQAHEALTQATALPATRGGRNVRRRSEPQLNLTGPSTHASAQSYTATKPRAPSVIIRSSQTSMPLMSPTTNNGASLPVHLLTRSNPVGGHEYGTWPGLSYPTQSSASTVNTAAYVLKEPTARQQREPLGTQLGETSSIHPSSRQGPQRPQSQTSHAWYSGGHSGLTQHDTDGDAPKH